MKKRLWILIGLLAFSMSISAMAEENTETVTTVGDYAAFSGESDRNLETGEEIQLAIGDKYTLEHREKFFGNSRGFLEFRSSDTSIVTCRSDKDGDFAANEWVYTVELTAKKAGRATIEYFDASTNEVYGSYVVEVLPYNGLFCVGQQKGISVWTTTAGGFQVSYNNQESITCTYKGYTKSQINSYVSYGYNYELSFSQPGEYTLEFTHNQTGAVTTYKALVRAHQYGEAETERAATCIETGLEKYTCTFCGTSYYQETNTTDHSWNTEYTVDQEADCLNDGKKSIHCSVCNVIQEGSEERISALGHRWNDEVSVDQEATCTENGVQSIHCGVCGVKKENSETVIPMTGHSFGAWITEKESSCVEAGKEYRICSTCKEKETADLPLKEHQWGSQYIIDREATIYETGQKSIHCEVCDKIKEDSIIILPKKEKIHPGLVIDDGIPYVYDENCNLVRNATPTINGKKYYVNGNGIAQSGWLRLADWQMYFDPDTYEAAIGISHIDGKAYLFDENGVEILMSRTEVINGKKYWFQPDGSLMSGWCILGDWTMYYDPETYVGAAGLTWINGIPYVFDENGVLIKNATPSIYGVKYFADSQGIARSGWLKLADWQMYFDRETYQAATGITHVNGKAYLFDENGVEILKSRTEVINGKKYWFQPDGTLMSGWCDLGNWKMYFDPVTYEAAVGYKYIDSDEYYFDENGVLIGYARYSSYERRTWYCLGWSGEDGILDTLNVKSAPEYIGQTGHIEIETKGWELSLEVDSSGVAYQEYEDEYGSTGVIKVRFTMDYIIIEVEESYRNLNAPYSLAELNGRMYYTEDLYDWLGNK